MSATCDLVPEFWGSPPPAHARSRVERLGTQVKSSCEGDPSQLGWSVASLGRSPLGPTRQLVTLMV